MTGRGRGDMSFRAWRGICTSLVLTVLCAVPALAQTRTVKVRSQLLGEERIVHVNLPPNYELAKRRYPVVYLLDGHVRQFFDVTVAAAAYDLPGESGYIMPPQIVVGVDQRERGVDLGRNQELFTRFLAEELVPFIDREFRTSKFRTLVGHSLGGRFALMTLCRAPGVFPAVIAISGAGGDSTSASATDECLKSSFAAGGDQFRQLVLAGGGGEPRILAGVERLRTLLRVHAPPTLRWTVIDLPGLAHSETPLATIPQGLRFVHDGSVWEMPRALLDSVAGSGPLGLERAVRNFHTALSKRMGFEVKPSPRWLITVARLHFRGSTPELAEDAARRMLDEYPEDLEAYGLLSELAIRRGDHSTSRRILSDARKVFDKTEFHDVYERERKRKILDDMTPR